jgi:hypothetical protein
VTIWVILLYVLVLLLVLLAMVGTITVLRRLSAQQKLREELVRLEGELGREPPATPERAGRERTGRERDEDPRPSSDFSP